MKNFSFKNKVKSNGPGAILMCALSLFFLLAVVCPKETKAAAAFNKAQSAGSAVSNSVVTYDLQLCDVVVTSENCNDIQFGQESGTASYDPDTKTLTLEDVSREISDDIKSHRILINKIDGLTIKIKGFVWTGARSDLTSSEQFCTFELDANTVIESVGTSYLTICGVGIGKNTEVVFRNIENVQCLTEYGIRGVSGEDGEKLVLEHAGIYVSNSITNIASLELRNSELESGKTFDSQKHAVVCDGEIANKIWFNVLEEYDLWVAGNRVNIKNCNALSHLPGVKSDSVWYDRYNKTLHLQKCTIEAPQGEPAIRSGIKDFKLEFYSDDNYISSKGAPALKFENGKVSVKCRKGAKCVVSASDDQPAILATDSIVFSDAYVAAGGKYGLSGGENGVYVSANGGSLKFYGKEAATYNLSGWEMEELLVKSPANADYDSKLRAFGVGGKLVSDTLFISLDRYPLYFGTYNVNELNCNDLSVFPSVEGKASYDPATNTLTLDNAKVATRVTFEEKDAILEVKGKSQIIVPNDSYLNPLEFGDVENAFIRGLEGAQLTLKGGKDVNGWVPSYGMYIYTYSKEAKLTVSNCDMDITSDVPLHALILYSTKPDGSVYQSRLRLSNSHIKLNTDSYPLSGFSKVELLGCKISSPKELLNYNNGFYYNQKGEYYKGSMEIVRDNTVGIETVKTEVPAAMQGVYTIDGVKLDTSEENLPAGLYIINGKKVLKK